MVYIWVASVVLFVFGCVMEKRTYNIWPLIICVVCGGLLFVSVALWPVNYYGVKAEIVAYYELRDSIERARQDDMSELERAALTTRIIENNTQLQKAKYWNQTIFNVYYPDEIMELEPLR